MRNRSSAISAGFAALIAVSTLSIQAAPHISRRLGNPRTRFADPLSVPQDLRDRLTSEKLKSDVIVILNLCDGWQGDENDFFQAAATAPIKPLRIPVGGRMPAMSARKNGKPFLHRDLVWGGTAPIEAYEFFFYSRGHRYRCITPKPCCNFWVENVGPDDRKPVLALSCDVPESRPVSRRIPVCLTLENSADVPAEKVSVRIPVPEGANYISPEGDINTASQSVVWRDIQLAPRSSHTFCVDFIAPRAGEVEFSSEARDGADVLQAASRCSTIVTGVPAVLLEVIDLADPVEIGHENTYEIRVTNQGSAVLTQIGIVCTLEDTQTFVSATDATAVQAEGGVVTLTPLAELPPEAVATWRVVVKAVAAGDVRFAVDLSCPAFERPISETEATQQY